MRTELLPYSLGLLLALQVNLTGNAVTFGVLTVVGSIVQIFLVSVVTTAVGIDHDDLEVVVFDALHHANIQFLHFPVVDVQVHHLINDGLDAQVALHFLFSALVPSHQLADRHSVWILLVLFRFASAVLMKFIIVSLFGALKWPVEAPHDSEELPIS